jgi:putative ATP-binding cassette transporter
VAVDWSTEWFTSTVWILGVTLAAALGSWLIGWLLTRSTEWGRQFARLAFPYFSPRGPEGWRPLLTALGVLALAIAAVRVSVLNSYINSGLFTALQELDAGAFARFVGIFALLSVAALAQALLAFYFQQRLVIRWRVWLNDRILDDWLGCTAYHRGRYTSRPVDNPDQRIQEDVASFTSESTSLAVGAVSSLVSLVSFTLILWQLSGPLNLLGVEVPKAMVVIAYLYVVVATVIAFWIGASADRAELPERAIQRVVPLRPGAAAGELRRHRVPPG